MAVHGALLRYRILAYIVGCMLIVVFATIPFGKVEAVIGPIHGALYITYLFLVVDLVRRARLGVWTLLAMVTGGWIPFAAFIVERRVSHRLQLAGVAGPAGGGPAGGGPAGGEPAASTWPPSSQAAASAAGASPAGGEPETDPTPAPDGGYTDRAL